MASLSSQGESEKRKVYHYQYLKWPESKMPVADHVFEMIDSVKERKASLNANTENTPIVLHCRYNDKTKLIFYIFYIKNFTYIC